MEADPHWGSEREEKVGQERGHREATSKDHQRPNSMSHENMDLDPASQTLHVEVLKGRSVKPGGLSTVMLSWKRPHLSLSEESHLPSPL